MVRFVVYLHCPALSSRFGVPLLFVDVPSSVVASYLFPSRSRRSRSLPPSFLAWLEDALRSRGVSLPSPGWFGVRFASAVRVRRPLPLVVLG